jgi:hypothetical protein
LRGPLPNHLHRWCPSPSRRSHESRGVACVLAEAVHLVLRLFDRLVAKEGGKFYVK